MLCPARGGNCEVGRAGHDPADQRPCEFSAPTRSITGVVHDRVLASPTDAAASHPEHGIEVSVSTRSQRLRDWTAWPPDWRERVSPTP
jgi:hypothetical protein